MRHSADSRFSSFPLDLSLERLRCAAPFQHLPMILSHAAHVVECAVGRVAWCRVALKGGTRRTPASRVSLLIYSGNGYAALRSSSDRGGTNHLLVISIYRVERSCGRTLVGGSEFGGTTRPRLLFWGDLGLGIAGSRGGGGRLGDDSPPPTGDGLFG